MSRIGKQPVVVPSGVEATINGQVVSVKGPKGSLSYTAHEHATLEKRDGEDGTEIVVTVEDVSNKLDRALWGTTRTNIANLVVGVTVGFTKKLEVNGVGYKVALSGKGIQLHVGFSHPVDYALPEGVSAEVEKNVITLVGIDKQLIGQVAAEIRKIRKPEPYKGKGIKYMDEVIRRKAGKAAKA